MRLAALTLFPEAASDIPCLRLGFLFGETQDGRAEQLAAKRRNAELTIRQAAQRFGVTASEWCGLEIGRYTLSDDQWTWLLSQI